MSSSPVAKLCAEFFDWRLKEFPEFASYCGFHQYDDKLNDFTDSAFQRREKEVAAFLEKAKHLEAEEKTEWEDGDELSLQLLTSDLSLFLNGIKYFGYLFAINYAEGLHIDFEQITAWMLFKTIEDYKVYVRRLKAVPQRLSEDEELLRTGVRSGITASKFCMKGVLEALQALNKPVEETVFYQPFKTVDSGISENELKPVKEEAVAVIRDEVIPAFQKLATYVEKEYISACRPEEAISGIPGGKEFYQQCLNFHTSLDYTPEEIHQIGLKEVARIKAEMEQVIEKIGFKGSFEEFIKYLRTDEKFYYKSKEDLLAGFKDICENQIRPALPKVFSKIPASELIIELMPPSRSDMPMGYYLAGTLDGSRPGKFWVNGNNLKYCPKYEMMALSLHEGEPGHHFQIMYSVEKTGVPAFRQYKYHEYYSKVPAKFDLCTAYTESMYAIETQKAPAFRKYLEDMYYAMVPSRFGMATAYMEGWGLYCESLGLEMGLYEDPYSLFGKLSMEMHRACRLVVDTGLHAFGWSYDKAHQFCVKHTVESEEDLGNEIRRYITWPGQACAYKIGQMKIQELREKATKDLGAKFDVQEFHREILECLAVPLPVLESVIQKYIDRVKKN